MLNFKFDVIGITETKIKKDISPDYDLNITGYKHYFTPTECDKGGTMLYISDHYNCVPRKNLEKIAYKSYVLESTFAEIIIPGKKKYCTGLYLSTSLNEGL